MDRNSIIGYVLIFAIVTGFYYYTAPSELELAQAKHAQDSIAQLDKTNKVKALAQAQLQTARATADSASNNNDTTVVNSALAAQFGDFAAAATLSNATYTIENDVLKATIAAKGGRVVSLKLKNYKTDKGAIIEMVDKDSSNFALSFKAQNRTITTADLNFTASAPVLTVAGNDSSALSVKMTLDANRYIEYVYSIKGNSYMLHCGINIVGMQNLIAPTENKLAVNWQSNMLSQENTMENQRNASTIYYNTADEDVVDNLSERGADDEAITEKIKWVAFRQQFFTQTLIASTPFEGTSNLTTTVPEGSTTHVKNCTANLAIPYRHTPSETVALSFLYAPTQYHALQAYGNSLEKQIPLGMFGFINKYVVIPVFDFLGGFNLNYGIVILLLTIFIKMILLPLTYKAYLSTAKMKVLKPEIDEISKRFPDTEQAMEKQKETMSLYRKAGVSPFGGCLPMVLQMPILFSMFRFFPASFELRQKSFLWATDLSTYDSIYNFGFSIPLYGDHISLFTILMTVSTIIYTKMNSSMTGQDDNPQMQSLKYMMYLMPIMFMFMFNSYASGLSYYYFLANILTFAIQYCMKFFVDEKALHLQIEENKKKPVKASAWQQKIEDLAKQKGINPPKK
jgi:YidC/Oxa1 family membrane protein insertase